MNVIKNLFLPEKIGSYYIFPKHIVGFDINKHVVHAAYVYVQGKKITIKDCLEELIEPGTQESYSARVSAAVTRILNNIPKYDAVHSSMSSSVAIFKTLVLPFTTYEKIKMVVAYEIEPSLPFALKDAVIDFVITKVDKENNQSEVLVVAVQKQYITQHLSLFENLPTLPDVITIDMIALYNLYCQISYYSKIQGGVALIDLRSNETRIMYINNGQLKLIRSISDGLLDRAKEISSTLNITPKDAMEQILRFGHGEAVSPEFTKALSDSMSKFWNKISFTLNSLSAQNTSNPINKIIVLGEGATIKDVASFAQKQLDIECELFKANELFNDKQITIENKNCMGPTHLISLGTALPAVEPFNLRTETSDTSQADTTKKQLLTALGLSLAMLLGMVGFSWYKSSQLSSEVNSAATQGIKKLKFVLDDKVKGKSRKNSVIQLDSMVRTAQTVVKDKEKTWFAFDGPARATFLHYLYELFTTLDKESLGLTINQLSIKDDVLNLKGEVRDLPSLAIFNQRLRESKLFKYIGSLQEEVFDIDIPLSLSEEE